MSASEVTCTIVRCGDARIEVLAQGQGHPIVLLPSLGRGAEDFDAIAVRLVAASFRVLRPQPRGIGQSRGPMAGIDVHTYAADIAAVIEHDSSGPALVVGHAPSPPNVRTAIKASANPSLPDAERLKALQFAFFAPGNDPSGWLAGWH